MQINIVSIIIVLFFICPLSGIAQGEDISKSVDEFLKEVTRESEKDKLRLFDSYKRMYRICSEGYRNYSKVRYAYESAAQVTRISFLNKEEINRLFSTDDYILVSDMLWKDLHNPTFFLAMEDCNYSSRQIIFTIFQLAYYDFVGKMTGIFGIFSFYKYLSKFLSKGSYIATSYPKIYQVILGTGIIGVFNMIHELFKNEDMEEQKVVSESDVKIISTVDDIENHFGFAGYIGEIKVDRVNKFQSRIKELERNIEGLQFLIDYHQDELEASAPANEENIKIIINNLQAILRESQINLEAYKITLSELTSSVEDEDESNKEKLTVKDLINTKYDEIFSFEARYLRVYENKK